MDTTYRLSQTGKEVQALLDQVTPNEQAIAQEQERAMAAESALDAKIDAETTRATDAEGTLDDKIEQEVTDRTDAVSAETSAREQADTAEATARDNADAALDAKIDAETSRAEASEGTLDDKIEQEVTDRKAAVTAEATARQQADTALQQAVTAEATTRANADAALDAKIDAETSRAEAAEGTLDDKIEQEVTDRTAAVTAEATARQQADTAQQQALAQETSRAQQAELANAQAIGNEAQARTAADTTILDNLQAEARTRLAADADLQEHIDDEETRAKAAEGVLTGAVSAEATARVDADAALQTAINGKQDTLTFDEAPIANSQNPVKSQGIRSAIDQAVKTEETRAKAAEQVNSHGITDLKAVVPTQASAQNQLADKEFVNSSIASNTGKFQGNYNLVTDLHLTTAATTAETAAALLTAISGASNNDYCLVQVPSADATPDQIKSIDRYKFDGTKWQYEYSINNSSFTAEELAAIQSGITAPLVQKLDALYTKQQLDTILDSKQDTIADLAAIRSGSAAGSTAYQKPQTGIPASDLSESVQASLGKADTALQEHQSLADYATKQEVTAAVNAESTRAQQAETTLNTNLSQEATARADADTNIQAEVGLRNVTVMTTTEPSATDLTYTMRGTQRNHIVGDKRIYTDTNGHRHIYFLEALTGGEAVWQGGVKVYLNKNNGVLTQSMMNAANTIYVIQYDFTLGEDITIPEDCVLEFEGGSLSGRTLIGNNTSIIADQKAIFNNIVITGSWICPKITSNWFADLRASSSEDTSNDDKIRQLFNLQNDNIQNTIIIESGDYYGINTVGAYNGDPLIHLTSNTTLILNGNIKLRDSNSDHYWIVGIINSHNVTIKGSGSIVGDRYINSAVPEESTGKEWGYGLMIQNAFNVSVSGIVIYNCIGDGVNIEESEHVKIENVEINNCRRQGITVDSGYYICIANSYIHDILGTNPRCGVLLEQYTPVKSIRNIIISNNIIKNVHCGVGVDSMVTPQDLPFQNIEISNNIITVSTDDGVSIFLGNTNKNEYIYNVIVSNNVCNGGNRPLIISYVKGASVVNNECTPSGSIDNWAHYEIYNLIFKNNRINLGRFVILNGENVILENNIFRGKTFIHTDGIEVINNTFYDEAWFYNYAKVENNCFTISAVFSGNGIRAINNKHYINPPTYSATRYIIIKGNNILVQNHTFALAYNFEPNPNLSFVQLDEGTSNNKIKNCMLPANSGVTTPLRDFGTGNDTVNWEWKQDVSLDTFVPFKYINLKAVITIGWWKIIKFNIKNPASTKIGTLVLQSYWSTTPERQIGQVIADFFIGKTVNNYWVIKPRCGKSAMSRARFTRDSDGYFYLEVYVSDNEVINAITISMFGSYSALTSEFEAIDPIYIGTENPDDGILMESI